jgi:hypothetical protein
VVPAKAGIQRRSDESHWIPAFAGTTREHFFQITNIIKTVNRLFHALLQAFLPQEAHGTCGKPFANNQ